MATPTPKVFYLLFVPIAALACVGAADVRDACSVTRHQSLCFRSLAPFAGRPATPKAWGPHWWARAAVSVTIAETKRARLYLSVLKRSGRLRGKRAGNALADCLECLDDALLLLGGALGELRRLRAGSFGWQMSNVETWTSAAMTDGDTCLEGLGGVGGPQATAACGVVRDVTYMTSNALAFVHELATSRGRN